MLLCCEWFQVQDCDLKSYRSPTNISKSVLSPMYIENAGAGK